MSRYVADWVAQHAVTDPHVVAVSDDSGEWSNARLEGEVSALAVALRAHGVGEGTRISSLLGDGAPAIWLIHAARRIGAVLVPLNRRSAGPELRAQIVAAAAWLLLHDARHAEKAESVVKGISEARLVALETLMDDKRRTEGQDAPARDVDLAAPATILFTSGTSAQPKGAVLSHGNHVASADAWATVLQPRPSDRWLACLPLFHVAGLAIVMRASRWGVALDVHHHFDVVALERALESGVSHVSLVVPMLQRLLDHLGGRPPAPTLRAILLGGGPIPTATLARARAAGLPIVTTYGMTETASGIAAGFPGSGAADPLGLQPLPEVQIRIERRPQDRDGVGEIVIEGPMVFSHYLEADGERQATDAEGRVHSGDLGSLDADGRLHLADRREDLIISGGENVYPAEVEAVLLAFPGVAEAAVVGRPDAAWGAVPIAAVVPEPGVEVADATLEAHCRERLAGFKVPVEFHRLRALPRNTAGKILRRDLRDSLPREPE